MFYDTEHDTIITMDDLKTEYETIRADHGTDAETLGQYISACLTVNNGTLERI